MQMLHLNLGFSKIINQIIQTTISINLNIHGTVSLVTTSTGNAISLTGNSYVTVNNTGFNACLKDVDTCSSGFTLTINVNLKQLANNTYIISSGGDLQNHKGIALYYNNNKLHFIVTTTSHQWIITAPNPLTLNTWHKIELSWSQTSGSSLIVDGNLIGSVSQSVSTTATLVKPLTIGFGYTQQVAVSMVVSGIQTFDSHRENLVVNGLVTSK